MKISLYEKDFNKDEQPPEETKSVVAFQLDDEWYGIDIFHVKEVIPVLPLTLLPNTPDHILGIVNLRGNILSVTNIKILLGLSNETVQEASRIIVINDQGVATGLLVDHVEEASDLPCSLIDEPVVTLEHDQRDLFEGQIKWKGRLIALLNAPKIIKHTRLKEEADGQKKT